MHIFLTNFKESLELDRPINEKENIFSFLSFDLFFFFHLRWFGYKISKMIPPLSNVNLPKDETKYNILQHICMCVLVLYCAMSGWWLCLCTLRVMGWQLSDCCILTSNKEPKLLGSLQRSCSGQQSHNIRILAVP